MKLNLFQEFRKALLDFSRLDDKKIYYIHDHLV